MVKESFSIIDAKRQVALLQDNLLKVTINLGRNKFLSYLGTLNGVYPALFTIKPIDESFRGKTSYSYAEFMCKKVTLKKAN